MDTRDFRSIGRSAQEELRRRALFLIEHDGLTQAKAARVVGVQRQAVNIWLRRYRAEGKDGVLDGRRVSPRRGKGVLTEDEARQVGAWIVDKNAGSVEVAVRALDHTGGARPDRAALRPCSRAVKLLQLALDLTHR